ncbi:MAG TPA: hypothetical protein VFM53_02175 [Anaeromyxobacteraceae bacterium]|nr:hypothetical protein [Anaeromyxobacteraceae bacterium]
MKARTVGAVVAVLLAGALAPAARAADPVDGAPAAPEPVAAFTAGARLSAAFPMGSVLSDPASGPLLISELVALSIPIQADVGLTLHRRWFVGAYVQYAWSFMQVGQCKVGQDCSVTGLRVGVEATYAFGDHGGPWAGLGTGWEWMFTSISSPTFARKVDVSGWEFANVQGGWDVEVSPGWKVGPWVSVSVGEFSRATLSGGGAIIEQNIANTAVHGWLQFGLRGTFGP